MKTLLSFMICLLVLTSSVLTANAQDLHTLEDLDQISLQRSAEQYYQRCLDNVYIDLSFETRDLYCDCTSKALKKNFTPNEARKIATGAGSAYIEPKKLATDLQAPCLLPVLYEVEQTQCLYNPGNRRYAWGNEEALNALCDCVANNFAENMMEQAEGMIIYMVTKMENYGREIENIIENLKQEQSYRHELHAVSKECQQQFYTR